VVAELAKLTAPGGALVILDYAHHDDESMRDQADLWLGFEASELKKFARSAGLEGAEVTLLPSALIGRGPDAHLPWQILIARKSSSSASTARRTQKGTDHHG
jgi:hypothetical protein